MTLLTALFLLLGYAAYNDPPSETVHFNAFVIFFKKICFHYLIWKYSDLDEHTMLIREASYKPAGSVTNFDVFGNRPA